MKSLLSLLMLFVCALCLAQEPYKITYDYVSGKTTYLRLNDKGEYVEIEEKDFKKRTKFKRNEPYKIEVVYNPLAVDLDIEKDEKDYHYQDKSIKNIQQLINLGQAASDQELSGFDLSDIVNKGNDEGNSSNDLIKLKELKHGLIGLISNPNTTIEKLRSDIKQLLRAKGQGLYKTNYADDTKQWLLIIEELRTRIRNIEKNIDDTIVENKGKSTELDRTSVNELDLTLSEANNNINLLENILISATNSKSSATKTFKVEKDETDIHLKFHRINYYNSSNNTENQTEPEKEEILIVKAKGGIKINTSVALTLNNFGENSNDYFVRSDSESGENTIGSDENNYFVPNLATLINFYPYWGKDFNLGGVVGVSVPLNDSINGLNFLLGGTAIIGNQDRIALNGGITYGPVQRLKNGLKVGDVYNGNSNDITKTVYDVGLFFGFSFNLFTIKD